MIPRNCLDRKKLYSIGNKMLKYSSKKIIAVSTIKNEDYPFRCSDRTPPIGPEVKDYFIRLHQIGYENRTKREIKKIIRYVDLTDQDKCQEAMTLLFFGEGIEIKSIQIQFEFLLVDNRALLVGFPADDELFGGFYSYQNKMCETMMKYIEKQEQKMNVSAFNNPIDMHSWAQRNNISHGDDCLCNICDLVGDKNVTKKCEDNFNDIVWLMKGLYSHIENPAQYYSYLVDEIINLTGNKKPTWLDVGCGIGFGAEELCNRNIKYYGVDLSQKSIDAGIERNKHVKAKFIAADIFMLLLKINNNGILSRYGIPNKFDVISCQGNTFDFFMGPVQKAMALFLFDKWLKPGGMLIFTGERFTKREPNQSRALQFPTELLNIEYRLNWKGDYFTMKIVNKNSDNEICELLMHPTDENWLACILGKMDYSRQIHRISWFAPQGGKPYALYAFQKKR